VRDLEVDSSSYSVGQKLLKNVETQKKIIQFSQSIKREFFNLYDKREGCGKNKARAKTCE
jgi:hypothetical protein